MSSDDIAISVRNLGKTYRLFGHPGDRVKQFLSLGMKKYHNEFTALNDVSFDIKKGETVGIIGRNGAGKSTLLQLICGILKPTTGSVKVNGRISALLELGAGFNPEFTGRENVYFQGAVMGISKEEMDARFDEITAFADIGEFVDQAVRTYSSGMFVRLAFALAVSVDPDVLVVDEAIAVGDPGFRARCFGRIVELRNDGCTILFVSHAMDQILKLCDRSILLDAGELVFHGSSVLAVQGLNQLICITEVARPLACAQVREILARGGMFERPESNHAEDNTHDIDTYVDGIEPEKLSAYPPIGAVIENANILIVGGRRVNLLRAGARYSCSYRVRFLAVAKAVRFAALIRTRSGGDLGGAWSASKPAKGIAMVSAGDVAEVDFEFDCLLYPGDYQISLAVFACDGDLEYIMHGVVGAVAFRVGGECSHCQLAYADFNCRTSVSLQQAVLV